MKNQPCESRSLPKPTFRRWSRFQRLRWAKRFGRPKSFGCTSATTVRSWRHGTGRTGCVVLVGGRRLRVAESVDRAVSRRRRLPSLRHRLESDRTSGVKINANTFSSIVATVDEYNLPAQMFLVRSVSGYGDNEGAKNRPRFLHLRIRSSQYAAARDEETRRSLQRNTHRLRTFRRRSR